MRRNQIRSSSETDESIYIGGGVSSVEYWLSWSAGRRRTIVVALDGLFRVKLKTAVYPLHSPLSPSLLLPCVAVCHQIPFPLYHVALTFPSVLKVDADHFPTNITRFVTITGTDCVFSKVGITLLYKILINPELQEVIHLLRQLIAGF